MREAIVAGTYGAGRFLPPVRELSQTHGISAETVRRGLKVLESEGLLVSKARRGFRVAPRRTDDVGSRPIAYITEEQVGQTDSQPTNLALLNGFQGAMSRLGSSALGLHSAGQEPSALLAQLKAGQAWGVALDTMDRVLLDTVRRSGLPVVMVNSCFEEAAVDSVVQDNYRGGFLAARHLIDSGCRRIAWYGALGRYYHSRERYAGACAALAGAGMYFDASTRVEVEGPGALARALELLGRAERPDGVLAFSAGAMAVLRRACREMDVEPEVDLRAVGWMVEEHHSVGYLPLFGEERPSPAIVWKASSMVERALALLGERRAGRTGEPVRVCVPTRLRFGGE